MHELCGWEYCSKNKQRQMDIAQEMLTKFNNDYLYFDVNNDARHGRPSTSTTDENMEAVKKIILDNC